MERENCVLSESAKKPLNEAQEHSQYERSEKRDPKKHKMARKKTQGANAENISTSQNKNERLKILLLLEAEVLNNKVDLTPLLRRVRIRI